MLEVARESSDEDEDGDEADHGSLVEAVLEYIIAAERAGEAD